jgi:predicted dehydrogenase
MAANLAGRLSNGALTSIVGNYCNPSGIGFWGNEQLRVHGTGGMIELTDGLTRRALVCDDAAPGTFPDVAPESSYPQDLVDCILDGTPTLLTGPDSFRNTEVVLCAAQSATIGQPVNISGIVGKR